MRIESSNPEIYIHNLVLLVSKFVDLFLSALLSLSMFSSSLSLMLCVDLKAVGASYGFVVPPHIDIGVAPSKKGRARNQGGDKKDFKKTKIFRQPNSKGKIKFSR